MECGLPRREPRRLHSVLFYHLDNSGERFRVVHGQVGEDFAVEFDVVFV